MTTPEPTQLSLEDAKPPKPPRLHPLTKLSTAILLVLADDRETAFQVFSVAHRIRWRVYKESRLTRTLSRMRTSGMLNWKDDRYSISEFGELHIPKARANKKRWLTEVI